MKELDWCLFSHEESSSEPHQPIRPEICWNQNLNAPRKADDASQCFPFWSPGCHWLALTPDPTFVSDARLRLLPAGRLDELIYFEDEC